MKWHAAVCPDFELEKCKEQGTAARADTSYFNSSNEDRTAVPDMEVWLKRSCKRFQEDLNTEMHRHKIIIQR